MIRLSLKNKLTISIVLIILVFGSLATVSVFNLVQDRFIVNQKEKLKQAISEHSHQLGEIFNNASLIVETLASQADLVDYFQGDRELQDNEVLALLGRYNIGERFSAIYIMSLDGQALVSTQESFVGKNYGFRDYFQKAKQGQPAIDVAIGVTSKEPGYYFSHPVRLLNNEIIGVVIIKMVPEFAHQASLDILEVVEEGHFMLIDSHGIIINADRADRIYSSLGQLSPAFKEDIENKKLFQEIDIQPLTYDLVQNDLSNIKEAKLYELYDKKDNEYEILGMVPIPHTSFFAVIEQDQEVIMKPALQIAFLLSLFVIIAALFAALFIFILLTRFLKPLRLLQSSAREISMGHYDKRVNIKSKDEIGELAQDFNKMTDKLIKEREDIERKIVERTAELEKFNQAMTGRELRMLELKKEIQELKNKLNNKK